MNPYSEERLEMARYLAKCEEATRYKDALERIRDSGYFIDRLTLSQIARDALKEVV